MTIFLTSHIGGWKRDGGAKTPVPLSPDNGLVDNLKRVWPENARVLFIAAAADSYERNDSIAEIFRQALPMTDLPIRGIDVCDGRNLEAVRELDGYDVLILSGGHVPTQNGFFHSIGLKGHLADYDGILIGISAGTMNAAETVYAHPELEGEAVDPEYRRFLPGLGLTKLMILPHYQMIKDDVLDGLRVFEDIAYPDSMGREFYALVDGSYVLSENGVETLHGEAWRIKDGQIEQVCARDEILALTK